MAQNYIQSGNRITMIATQAVAAGDCHPVGNFVGVALNSAAIGDEVVLALDGVYQFTKATGYTVAIGDSIYWDNTSNKRATKTVGSNAWIGYAHKAAVSGDTTVDVYVEWNANPGVTTYVAPLGALTALTAIPSTFANLADARTAVNTLRSEVSTELGLLQAKVDALLAAQVAARQMAAS